jgi:HTH-type transcriptional regulator / antitoxin HigA
MDIRPLRTETDYDWALAEIEPYFADEPAPNSPEADRFDVLSALIQSYEAQHWSVDAPDPVSAIKHWMELNRYSQSDLAAILGSRSRASELLGRKRPLSLAMAYRLHDAWKIPADILIKPYSVDLAA